MDNSNKTSSEFNKSYLNATMQSMMKLQHRIKQFMKADLTAQKEKYTAKVMHGYYERKINEDTQIDKHLSKLLEKS